MKNKFLVLLAALLLSLPISACSNETISGDVSSVLDQIQDVPVDGSVRVEVTGDAMISELPDGTSALLFVTDGESSINLIVESDEQFSDIDDGSRITARGQISGESIDDGFAVMLCDEVIS